MCISHITSATFCIEKGQSRRGRRDPSIEIGWRYRDVCKGRPVQLHRSNKRTTVSEEITGTRKLLVRSNAPASCPGFFVPFVLPMTIGDQRFGNSAAFITSRAARSPLSRAPCAVEKKFGEVASPAKNSRPSTGAASAARSPACPGRAWE
jgi:hypothetical protein